jgi:hypothetical protein
MPVYTVHAPPNDAQASTATDRFVFVRDGFHVWALLAGVFWLAYHRLWLALIGCLGLIIVASAALSLLQAGSGTRMLVLLLIGLLLGFEAASLWRWTLSRRNWRQLDIVVADDEEAAERRFFDRWNVNQPSVGGAMPTIDRGAPPPARRPPAPPRSDILGLFPGASR